MSRHALARRMGVNASVCAITSKRSSTTTTTTTDHRRTYRIGSLASLTVLCQMPQLVVRLQCTGKLSSISRTVLIVCSSCQSPLGVQVNIPTRHICWRCRTLPGVGCRNDSPDRCEFRQSGRRCRSNPSRKHELSASSHAEKSLEFQNTCDNGKNLLVNHKNQPLRYTQVALFAFVRLASDETLDSARY